VARAYLELLTTDYQSGISNNMKTKTNINIRFAKPKRTQKDIDLGAWKAIEIAARVSGLFEASLCGDLPTSLIQAAEVM